MKPRNTNRLFLAALWLLVGVGAALVPRAPESPPAGRLSKSQAEEVALALCKRLYQQHPAELVTTSLAGRAGQRDAGRWSVECTLDEGRLYLLIAGDTGQVVRLARDGVVFSSPAPLSPREVAQLASHWLRILGAGNAVFEHLHAGNPYDLHFRCGAAEACRIAIDSADGRVNRYSHGPPRITSPTDGWTRPGRRLPGRRRPGAG